MPDENNNHNNSGSFDNPLARPIKRQPDQSSDQGPATPPLPPPALPSTPPVNQPQATPPPAEVKPAPPAAAPARPQPLPPPPPLTSRIKPVNDNLGGNNAKLPDSFSIPTEDEIKQEEQRLKVAERSQMNPPTTSPPPPPPPPPPASTETPVAKPPAPTTVPEPPVEKLSSQQPTPPPEKLTVQPPASERSIPIPPPPPVQTPAKPPAVPPPPPAAANQQFALPKPDIPLGTEEPPTAPRRRWPIVVIILVVLVGLVWYLQSAGFIYASFLARMFGGVPRNPDSALTVVQNEASTLGSYAYQSAVAVSFSSTLPDIGADASSVVPDASGTVSGQVDSTQARTDFDFVLGSNYTVSTLKGTALIDDKNATFFFDTLSLLQPTNNWRRIPRTDSDNYALMLPLLQTNLSQLLAHASNGQFLGKSTLNNNQPALTYTYDLSPLIKPTDATINKGRLALWVNKKDGKILVAQADTLISTSAGDVLLQVQTTMSNYGSAQVEPIDSQAVIDDSTVKDVYEGLGVLPSTTSTTTTDQTTNQTTSTPAPGNANDATRTADLQKIAQALSTYKNDFGLYPISRDLVKSTTAGNILESDLVPNYLAALPTDPLGTKYYYGYKSDGFSYTLTSILEDGSVEGAKQGNGFSYQEITN